MSAKDFYNGNNGPANNGPPPTYGANTQNGPVPPPPAAGSGNSWPQSGQQNHGPEMHNQTAKPGDAQQYQYGQYAPPPGPGGPSAPYAMQHSNSYGPPANYPQGPPGNGYPNPYGQPPPNGQQPTMMFIGHPQPQQQQQSTDRGSTGCIGTCLAVMCGICAADMCCDLLF